MKLILADRNLRRSVDSHTSWFQYVVPELQNYWIAPEVWAHKNFPGGLDPLLVRTEFGQEIPKPLPIKTVLSEHCDNSFEQVPTDRNTCLFIKGADADFAQAAVDWLNRLKPGERPNFVLDLNVDSEEALTTLSEAPANVKFVSSNCSPVTARVQPKYTAGKSAGCLFAILANHSEERGERLLPQLAESLLARYPDAALLIHHGEDIDPAIRQSLAAFESVNRRLVYIPNPLPLTQWFEILSAVDLAILPYDPQAFLNRKAWLLDELLANGIPAVVPAHTTLSQRIASFGILDCTFDRYDPLSIVNAVSKAVRDYGKVSGEFSLARQQWERTQGAKRLVHEILDCFPAPRLKQQPLPKYTKGNSSKRILLSWPVDPSYIPPPRFSENQVTVGPHPLSTTATLVRPNSAASFAAYTPFFHTYDLKEIVELQGIVGPFDLVIVAADSAFSNTPLNVKAFGCPTLLYAGDTHWGHSVIRRMTSYAVTGEFDYVVTPYNRQHMHWYKEAGKHHIAWIPGLAIRHLPQPFEVNKDRRIAFSGQKAGSHAHRKRLLDALEKAGLPLDARSASREESAALYNSSLVSLNVSMNGDLNLRMFEVLSAGGCLLTDRLAPEAGQSLLFEDGREFASFSNERELLDTARRLLMDSNGAASLAAKGHKKYIESYLPERQTGILLDWIFSGKLPAMYGGDWDTRLQIAHRNFVSLADRMAIYEKLQQAHLEREQVRVLVAPGVPACIVADIVDLPRLSCFILSGEQTLNPVLRAAELADRVTFLGSLNVAKQKAPWDFLIATGKSSDLKAQLAHSELIIVPHDMICPLPINR